MVAPAVEQAAGEFKGKVKVFGMNVDEAPDTASSLGIMAIPALVFFKDGKEVSRLVGAVPKAKILDELKKIA